MRVKLVFKDWLNDKGESIYNTDEGIDLSIGEFHSGTTFDGAIYLLRLEEEELTKAIQNGYHPVFEVVIRERV